MFATSQSMQNVTHDTAVEQKPNRRKTISSWRSLHTARLFGLTLSERNGVMMLGLRGPGTFAAGTGNYVKARIIEKRRTYRE